MYTVMVTGGLGSGKSSLVELMCAHGALSLDLDKVNKTLLADDQAMIAELAERFGEDIVDEDGAVIPSVLAERAFASEEDRLDLNAISFPHIMNAATEYILDVHCTRRTDADVLVVEVQLLNEVPEFAKLADEVIAVVVPQDERLLRAVVRGMDAEDAARRLELQGTDAERTALADTLCDNSGSIEELEAWVDAWWQERSALFAS